MWSSYSSGSAWASRVGWVFGNLFELCFQCQQLHSSWWLSTFISPLPASGGANSRQNEQISGGWNEYLSASRFISLTNKLTAWFLREECLPKPCQMLQKRSCRMLNTNPTAFDESLFGCFGSDSSPEWSIRFPLCMYMWEKKSGKGLGATYGIQCPLQLLLKATEHLKPLGNFESCAGKRCLQSNLVHFCAAYPIFLRVWGTEQRKKQYVWLSFSVLIQPRVFPPVDRIGFEAVVVRTSLFPFCASRLWLSDLQIEGQQSVCVLLCFLTRLLRKPSTLSESFSFLHSSEGSSEHKNRKWGW